MPRPKAFDKDDAVRAAIAVFAEHGFEGTSTDTLVQSMGIGRQSLYDTFGDKWQLYLTALRRYVLDRVHDQLAALRSARRAIDGIGALIEIVVSDADRGCLGVGSICEFGTSKPEIAAVNEIAGRALREAISSRIREAQRDGDLAAALNPDEAAAFLVMNFAGMKIAARGGAAPQDLRMMGQLALRGLH